jgi:hypothetical protein
MKAPQEIRHAELWPDFQLLAMNAGFGKRKK